MVQEWKMGTIILGILRQDVRKWWSTTGPYGFWIKKQKTVVYADGCVTELLIPPLSVVMFYVISYFPFLRIYSVHSRTKTVFLVWCSAERGGSRGPGGLIETYICRMWAILLGCVLREERCNNRKGKKKRHGEAGRRGRVTELRFRNRSQSHNAISLESLWDVPHNQ